MAICLSDVTEVLDTREWHYTLHEDENYISMRMRMKAVDGCNCVLRVVNETTLICYAVFPIKAPEELRVVEAEYLCRANYGLYHGNFEIDMSDGEIRYKTTGMTTLEDPLDESVIARLINLSVSMLDDYAPGILSVIYANDSPEYAVDRVEEKLRREREEATE